MKTRLIILPFLVAVTAMALAADHRPNIVFFLADDFGLDGVGCYGSDRYKGKTPNIDALAKSGLRFERAYCTPLCGPTRCLLMTGRYGFRTGGLTNQSAGRPTSKDEPSVARTLKQAGYATGMAGKWRQVGETPGDWGFDEYITDPTAGGWYWKNNYTKNGKLVEADKEVYCPDVNLEFAKDFFRRHKSSPFYFYFPSHLVHGPILRTPDTKPNGDLYDDNVAYLDKQVGQVVAALDELGLREKTLILFSADNGTARFGADRSIINGRKISGQKGTLLEGGARVPFIASWQGITPAGKVLKDLVDFSDLHPTFAELAGAKLPSSVKLDGRSFAPQLKGEPGNPRPWIFVQLGAKWYVRNDGWKLNESGELFDLSDAPWVEQAVAADGQSARAREARQQLQAALDELKPASGKTASPDEKKAKTGKKKRKKQA